jgi:DNA polymerase I
MAASSAITELVAHATRLGATFRLQGDKLEVGHVEALPRPLYDALRGRRDELWALLGGDALDRPPLDVLSVLNIAPVIPTSWEKAGAALDEIEADSDRYTSSELQHRPGLIGMDIETAALPGAEARPPIKLRKDGLPAAHQPTAKSDAALDPSRSRIRLVQLYGGGRRCLILDTDLVSLDVLVPVLQRRTAVIHNAGFELRHLAAAGIAVPHFEDTMQATGLLLGAYHRSLDEAAAAYLSIELPKTLQTSDWSAPQLSAGQYAYAALDAIITFRLWLKLRAELIGKERGGAYLLQRDVTPAVARMTSRGILLDRAAHAACMVRWSMQLADARQAFIAATKQPLPGTPAATRAYLDKVLPEPLRSQWPRTAKTGALTLRAHELRRAAHLPAVQALLDVQAAEKLLDSFGDALTEKVSTRTGRLHPSFNIAGTKTGRFSANKPNVQQFPKRSAADFRDCIHAADGHVFVVGDFHMMELRAAAAISGDPQMSADFANGIDLHRQQAAAMLGIPYDQVDAQARDRAKPVNFSMIYGAGAAGLVATAWNNYGIVLTLGEAELARRSFLTRYATYAEWMARNHQQCSATGIIRIGRLGRVIEASWEKRKQPATNGAAHTASDNYFDEDDYFDDNGNHPDAGYSWAQQDQLKYTLCCNAPVQGACADAGMLALTAVDIALRQTGVEGGPVLFVHDEIVLEIAEQQAEQARQILASCMQRAFAETFPTAPLNNVVSIGVGKTWGSAKA